jgi:hypothetical protein
MAIILIIGCFPNCDKDSERRSITVLAHLAAHSLVCSPLLILATTSTGSSSDYP